MPQQEDERLIEEALAAASDTRLFRLGHGLRHSAAEAFASLFGDRPALVVADQTTFRVAGRDVVEAFRRAGRACLEPFVFDEPDLYAEYGFMERLERALASNNDAIAVAVGSGTINDLTKLAAGRLGRPYLSVATAASMDGYTAFGASITRAGSKQTFSCPAPAGVLADLETIAAAPAEMNAWGYADLLAKSVAGADWMVADCLDVEAIDPKAWQMVQSRLSVWTGDPAGIGRGDPGAVRSLILGLVMSGLAMQWTRSSRPASGAEHQFSHLWDMEHHAHAGRAVSHGFKVGIGTLASSALYAQLLDERLDTIDVDELCGQWPSLEDEENRIRSQIGIAELAEKAIEETRAKYPQGDTLRQQLVRLRERWPELRERIRAHLLPPEQLRARLAQAGCPTSPEQIGISPARLRLSYRLAYWIRRRYTVLDLAARTGRLEPALARIFGPQGLWPIDQRKDVP